MEIQPEKVYVAIGRDLYDGLSTLQWALRKWSNHSISIVIIHAANNIRRDYVYTPLGKLPASSVSEKKLKDLDKSEEEIDDQMISQFIASCGRIKAQVFKLEKNEQPIYKQLVEIIPIQRITKLVMSLTFIKSSAWKSRTAISGSFYILHHKPDFCELFVIYGGRLLSLREENNEGFIEDDRGNTIAKFTERNGFRSLLGRIFPDSPTNGHSTDSPSSSRSNSSPDEWEKYSEEIEQYVNQMLAFNEEEEEANYKALEENPADSDMQENMSGAERIEALKLKIQRAEEAIQLNKQEANLNKERGAKAEWAICLCNTRIMQLEICLSEEVQKNADLKKELDSRKDELFELQGEVEEKRSKLNSILGLQRELSNKLQLSSSAKSRAEIQLEKAVQTRTEMVREIEELRGQRDVIQLRIEFCREKDAIGSADRMNASSFDYREFTAAEISAATEDFSEDLRLKSRGQFTNVYKGHINHMTVAIKMYNSANAPSQESFIAKVQILSQIRHPNIVAMIGFCSELNCIIFEYMHNGCLHDALFLTERSSRVRNKALSWHTRIRIAAEVCSALGFLHNALPKPLILGNLSPSKIILDRNNVAKVYGLKPPWSYDNSDRNSDIRAFGNLMLQLLSGRNWAAPMDASAIIGDLDHSAGEWPLDLATELCIIAIRCLSTDQDIDKELDIGWLMSEINRVKKKADQLVANGEYASAVEDFIDTEDSSNVPSAFLCPIYQDVMQNPHLAADGFSYELDAIEGWLRTGHDTSPMTNLRLNHTLLTPNHTLRTLIQDWQTRRSAPPS
ncbi:U-box domain-containing 50 isoform X1 [Olea europaea subsp. europaea]|uniref:RING-type E3 ubiquitin transferase n=3 Tax=Olea europaea subsp. europaea TaxID=158383 RepID=A0A8S0V379_OLEEU|nr:U-box domain-containing 50 isoform X1 [Olea europaea subsp. europaea]